MLKLFIACLLSLPVFSCIATAQNNYTEISLPGLMKKKQQGDKNMVIVDVRTKGEYFDTVSRNKQSNIGRIKGAINITLQDLQENPETVKQLDAYKDKDIYLICSHSYRSRSASTILLKNGFTHVNNVQGGMTEWYRRYDELSSYMNNFYETGIRYKNISPAQVANDLIAGKNLLLIGISGTAKYFYDTAAIKFYEYFPLFKNAIYFNAADSLKVLQTVLKEKDRSVILFNMVNNGAAELAGWLTEKGRPNVSYLVGNNYYFYEYILNKHLTAKAGKFFVKKNTIEFITPLNYCSNLINNKAQLIDLRHDSLFTKTTSGIKYDYSHAKNSVNFFADQGTDAFTLAFPEKKKDNKYNKYE